MRSYAFETIIFTQERLSLPQGATVAHAREAFAHKWNCSPAALYFLLDGRVLEDDHRLDPEGAASSSYSRSKRPVIYKHTPIGGSPQTAAAVAPPRPADPPNFSQLVDRLMEASGNQYDRAAVEAVLRKANYLPSEAFEDIISQPPASKEEPPAIRPDHLERIRKKKPSNLPMDQAIKIYLEVCQGNIEMAELILPDAAS
jgi:hypothetical protein